MTALDASAYLVRPAQPGDAIAMRRMLERLQPQEVWMRFFRSIRNFSPELVAALLHPADARRLALVALEPAGDEIVGSAMLEPIGAGRAEFAVLVHHDHTHHGLGRRLIEGLLAGAAERGYACVDGLVRRENRAMLQLVAEMGARIHADEGEPDCMRVEFPVPAMERAA